MEKYRKDNREKIRKHDREYRRIRRKLYPEREKEIRKRVYEKRKEYIGNYKLNRGCAVCGYNRYASVLEFHHKEDKEFNINSSCNKSFEKMLKEMEKCEILCANCHRERHIEKGCNNE